MQLLVTISEVMATPALLVGLVVLVGLLLQKKPADHVIKGTVTTVVGFVLLTAGSDFLQEGALKDFGVLFNCDFNIQGVVPNMEAIGALSTAQYATEVTLVMFWGMVANILMARFGPFPYIFLTGHHTLYMAGLLTVALRITGMGGWQVILAGSLMLGLLMALMPALASREMRRITGGNKIALGHFSTIGYLAAAKTAELAARGRRRRLEREGKPEGLRSTEEINFPSRLSFMRDSTVGIFIVMTAVFLAVTGLAAARFDLAALDISYGEGGYRSWVTYALIQGAKFSGAIYVILAGVRLVVAEIVPAFKGIAKRIVPHAKPAVDCPVLFSYAPNAVMIGFLMSFLGGIVTMAALMGINAWNGSQAVAVIVPGVVAHFFCGGSAGVFANAEGGVRGCIAGSFVHGVLISLLSLSVMPVMGILNLSGTAFSDADFCAVGVLLGNLSSALPDSGVLLLCAACFAAPILWEQAGRRRKKKAA